MQVTCKQVVKENPSSEKEVSPKEDAGKITCAACSRTITATKYQIAVDRSFRHVFANPHGYVYEIGCFSKAAGCLSGSDSSSEFAWFSGYSWQIGICRYCASHLGWIFSSQSQTFYGLILDKLIFP